MLHRDIISDISIIPDLIIYRKTFNKSDCFIIKSKKNVEKEKIILIRIYDLNFLLFNYILYIL